MAKCAKTPKNIIEKYTIKELIILYEGLLFSRKKRMIYRSPYHQAHKLFYKIFTDAFLEIPRV